jgi:multidrug efflux pump subunit AcrA (membrane-fusion protein)
MQRTPLLLGAASFGAVAAAAAVWRLVPPAAESVPRASVWTERVRRGELVRQVPIRGILVAKHVQWLSAGSAARVAKVAVRPGARVEPGTVVMLLENPELELAALEAERQAASAEGSLVQLDVKTSTQAKERDSALALIRTDSREAGHRAEAAANLAREGLIGALDFRTAENEAIGLNEQLRHEEDLRRLLDTGRRRQLAAQQVEVDRLRRIATFRRQQLAALEVRAGFSGIVQEILVENGKWVTVGMELAKLAEPNQLKAEVKVAEESAREIYPQLRVRFEAPAVNSTGRVERIDPSVVDGSVRVEVELDDPSPSGARASQTVTGYVELERLQNVVCVARPAGVRDASSAAVFRKEPDSAIVSRVAVRFGRSSAREIEVLAGLAPGDEVIVSDMSAWEGKDRLKLD